MHYLPPVQCVFHNAVGYSRKRPTGGRGLRAWNFQGYWRKNMRKLLESIKKKWNFLGCFKKNMEFPWVLVFDFGISKKCHSHTILQNFLGWKLVFFEISKGMYSISDDMLSAVNKIFKMRQGLSSKSNKQSFQIS